MDSDTGHLPSGLEVLAGADARRRTSAHLFGNAQMGPKEIRSYCAPAAPVRALLRAAIQRLGPSAHAYDRLLKVTCTTAGLGREAETALAHMADRH